jgi:hypothetical protein
LEGHARRHPRRPAKAKRKGVMTSGKWIALDDAHPLPEGWWGLTVRYSNGCEGMFYRNGTTSSSVTITHYWDDEPAHPNTGTEDGDA